MDELESEVEFRTIPKKIHKISRTNSPSYIHTSPFYPSNYQAPDLNSFSENITQFQTIIDELKKDPEINNSAQDSLKCFQEEKIEKFSEQYRPVLSLLNYVAPQRVIWATAFMIGPRHALTAAHNYNLSGDIAQDIYVIFCPEKGEISVVVAKVIKIHLLNEGPYFEIEEDLALLILDFDIGNYTGWLGIKSVSEDDIELRLKKSEEKSEENDIEIVGYNISKDERENYKKFAKKLLLKGKMIPKTLPFKDLMMSNIKTESGMSGAPIIIKDQDNFFAIGIHVGYNLKSKAAISTLLSGNKIEMINQWINEEEIKLSTNPSLNEIDSNLQAQDQKKKFKLIQTEE